MNSVPRSWGELYSKRIDETIAALKSRGVPVVSGSDLPSIRGARPDNRDGLSQRPLPRAARRGRAGITYVDIWDGFVDEGRQLQPVSAPDFEGPDPAAGATFGRQCIFTQPGRRAKLAHYVERDDPPRDAKRARPPMTAIPGRARAGSRR